MTDLLKSVKKEIGHFRCPEHNELPEITIRGEKLNMKTCCDEFSKSLQKKMEKAVNDYTVKYMDNMFKKLGKR